MSDKQHIDPSIIESICSKIGKKKVVNEKLPQNGILFIDKMLPYICIHRFKEPDYHFFRLIKTQGSYIIAHESVNIHHLLEAIRVIISQKFETFLILEFWPEENPDSNKFEINCPKAQDPGTLNALKEGFESFKASYPNIKACVNTGKPRHPEHLPPLMDDQESKKTGTLIIGVSVPMIFRNEHNGELYSLFFREFYSVFSETVKRAAYEFIRVQNADDFQNYLMLGKTHIDASTIQADKELAEISEGMSFLLRATPVNSNEEWDKFKDNDYKVIPNFKYRLIALDPEMEKRKLYNIPIEQIEDPTIAFVLRGKRLEIEKQLTMLEERGTKNFRFVGESLYGVIKKDVLRAARRILKKFPDPEKVKCKNRLNCHDFAHHAQKELDYYNSKFPDLKLTLEIRNDVAGIMVSKTKLLINDEVSLAEDRTDALIQHEVGTHILTYCNGKQQPLCQMYEGFEGYDQLQEGIAVIAEYLVGGLTVNRLRLLAGRVLAVKSMIEGWDFIDTFKMLRNKYHFSPRISYYISMRVYRGGGLTKDAVYLAGVLDVLTYLKKGGSLETLYTGKFNVTHIEIINELLHRGVLKSPVLPRFLERESVQRRLKKLRKGIDIIELVN